MFVCTVKFPCRSSWQFDARLAALSHLICNIIRECRISHSQRQINFSLSLSLSQMPNAHGRIPTCMTWHILHCRLLSLIALLACVLQNVTSQTDRRWHRCHDCCCIIPSYTSSMKPYSNNMHGQDRRHSVQQSVQVPSIRHKRLTFLPVFTSATLC